MKALEYFFLKDKTLTLNTDKPWTFWKQLPFKEKSGERNAWVESCRSHQASTLILFNGIFLLLLRVEEHRTRHQNGMGKRVTLSLIYDKCMGILMCANGVETKEKRIYLR